MKTRTKIIAVAATLTLALAGVASAHPGFGMGPGMGWGPGTGHMGWGPGGGMGPGMGPGMGGDMRWGMGPGMGGDMRRGMGPGMAGGPGMGGFDMNASAAGHLAALKTQLKITPAQETAWKAYEGVVTQQASAMQAMRDQWQDAKPGAAAPDMAAQHQAMQSLRQSSWQAQDKAFKDLYAALTPEQQALVNGGRGGPRGLPRR
jgi:hypothetical protein